MYPTCNQQVGFFYAIICLGGRKMIIEIYNELNGRNAYKQRIYEGIC